MHRIKVCVVTGSRAEFGILRPLIEKLMADSFFEVLLVATGAHLSKDAGNTVEEIEKAKFQVSAQIPIPSVSDNSPKGVAIQISEVIFKFADYFSIQQPDCLIVLGDRYEIFGTCIAASTLAIPIIHISGGSVTSGAIDECYRHGITKMSSVHFPTCEAHRKRIIQLGEQPDVVYNVGSLAIENCIHAKLLHKEELLTQLGMEVDMPYCVVTYHPVTLEENPTQGINELLKALDENKQYQYLITFANIDFGGKRINEIWMKEKQTHSNFFLFASLGMIRYLSALKYAEMMIGNSSSGIAEGPAMKIPVIDIGDRQKGRIFSAATIHCDPNSEDISHAIRKASTEEFKEKARNSTSSYGDGTTSNQMISILKSTFSKSILKKKTFYDINFQY